MSVVIQLDMVPSQSLSIQLDDVRYDIRLRDVGGIMSLDMSINESVIMEGHRVVGGLPLIPYKYLESGGGNFVFITELGDIPYWDQFGATQGLLYFTKAELEEIRAS